VEFQSCIQLLLTACTQKYLMAPGVCKGDVAVGLTNLLTGAFACMQHQQIFKSNNNNNNAIALLSQRQHNSLHHTTMKALARMLKSKHHTRSLPPMQWPYPHCFSCPSLFKKLYKRVGQQPDCFTYVQALHQSPTERAPGYNSLYSTIMLLSPSMPASQLTAMAYTAFRANLQKKCNSLATDRSMTTIRTTVKAIAG
jgi:hypothetical protein